jgi:two-component system response regulator AtoC
LDKAIECSLAAGKLFFGTDGAMKEIRATIERIACADVPVLILGETGTGKEVLARQVHHQSPRSKKPFLKVNCAAVPSELVESELFGYERGAFTGAFQRKAGMFELADGGTIMLDEIGDMDFKLQAKLLQVLQDREFIRLGGKDTIRVDVRIIAATHQNLEKGIVENRFRQDLFYRLNVITMRLPSLRERRGDVVDLAHFLLRKNAPAGSPLQPITASLCQALLQYSWPGNIRELENTIHRLLIFQNPDAIAAELLEASGLSTPPPSSTTPVTAASESILKRVTKAKEQAESSAILTALDSCRWNRKQAASMLNIDYKALLYKIKKLNIE